MPIRPENRRRYPEDWPQIRARILERASNCCEACSVPNGTFIYADRERPEDWIAVPDEHVEPRPGQPHKRWDFVAGAPVTRVVLTIAHLDHQPENVREDNLRAMCQKCHLAHDAEHHRQTRRRNLHRRRGCGDLFELCHRAVDHDRRS